MDIYPEAVRQGPSPVQCHRQLPKDPNYADANYYYGFISFYEKKYSDALAAFKIVEDNPSYKRSCLIISLISTLCRARRQGRRVCGDEAEKGNRTYDQEMRQLVGHGYYEKQEFVKALPYWKQYVSQSKKVTREDLYGCPTLIIRQELGQGDRRLQATG